MRLEIDVTLHQRVEHVFAFLSDPRNRKKWQSTIRTLAVERDDEPAVGTRWRETVPVLGAVDLEITVFAPPYRWAERARSRTTSGMLEMTFFPEGDATVVHVEAEGEMHGVFRPFEPIAVFLMRRQIRVDLARADRVLGGEDPT